MVKPYLQRTSVVRPWVTEFCTLKMQTVMLSALRGPDGIPKEDISKRFTRAFRNVILFPAVPDATIGSFMQPGEITVTMKEQFTTHLDHYPTHWTLHFAHACEIVGYKHPHNATKEWWYGLYIRMVYEGFHLTAESEESLDRRLADVEGYTPE